MFFCISSGVLVFEFAQIPNLSFLSNFLEALITPVKNFPQKQRLCACPDVLTSFCYEIHF